MSFDGFFTRALSQELKTALVGGRVSKIYQPFERELQLVIRNHRQNFRLGASIHPTYYNMGLTEDRPSNPTHAPMFCMLLRKHLENAIVLDLVQIDNDRIIKMVFSGLDELGDQQTYDLYFEMMGRHSNILLVNPKKGTIIDCIKHVAPSLNAYRGLQPGAQYIQPPKQENQINPYNHPDLSAWADEHAEVLANGKGSRLIEGMGPLAANQVAHWINHDHMSPSDALKTLMSRTQTPQALLFESDTHLHFYHLDLSYLKAPSRSYQNLSDLVHDFYQQKIHQDRIKQVSGDLILKLKQLIEKNDLKLEKLDQDKQIALAADSYRIKGELLKANLYRLEKGSDQVSLENYYDDNQLLTISLDPRLSPNENAQAYFKRYSKYRDALAHIDSQIDITQAENAYLESVLVQVRQADIDDIEDIKEELAQEGYGSQRKATIKKRSKANTQPRTYQAADGTLILVGRNNQQNDELSLKSAHKNHWWLHAKNIPGSHVIIQATEPSDETITLAGQLAAYYSKFSQSAMVPVDMVQVKHLRKPNGAKPGYVIYEGQHTIYVTPDPDHLKGFEKKD